MAVEMLASKLFIKGKFIPEALSPKSAAAAALGVAVPAGALAGMAMV